MTREEVELLNPGDVVKLTENYGCRESVTLGESYIVTDRYSHEDHITVMGDDGEETDTIHIDRFDIIRGDDYPIF